MIGARIRKSEPLPEVVAWRRTDATFGQPGSLVIGSLAMTILGIACYVRTGAPWLAGWSAATLVVLLARLLLARAYWRQETRQDPELWARRFTIGAWSTGLLWAVISVVMVTEGDPLTHLLVLAVQGGFFAGAAARNSPLPAAAQGTLALGLGPMLLACLVNGEPTYLVLGCFVFLHLMAGIGVARFLGRQTVGLLLSNEEKAELVREIGRANAGLAEANARLEAIASTDALTGLTNRRGFDTALQALWSRAAQDGTYLALALIDVDRFKQFNDRLGHPAGDACLRALGQALQGAVRQGATSSRAMAGRRWRSSCPAWTRRPRWGSQSGFGSRWRNCGSPIRARPSAGSRSASAWPPSCRMRRGVPPSCSPGPIRHSMPRRRAAVTARAWPRRPERPPGQPSDGTVPASTARAWAASAAIAAFNSSSPAKTASSRRKRCSRTPISWP